MKNLLFCFLVVGLALSSCKKEDSSSNEFLTAKIDGTDYSATTIMAADAILLFQISGIGDQGTMAFSLNNITVAEGTYEFDGVTVIASFENSEYSWSAESGSIIITKYADGVIEGTFSFEGDNNVGILDPSAPDISVTEGAFSANVL